MSDRPTEEELLTEARQRAFEGMLFTTVMSPEQPLKAVLAEHFSAVLNTIDESRRNDDRRTAPHFP